MQLYTFDSAPNPRRLGLFLSYKGIDVPTQQLDMRNGEHLGDAFKAINPLGTLPALITDEGALLTEVVGICAYLEALHPEKPLMGRDPLESALVLSWDHRIYVGLLEAFAEMLRNRSPAFANRAAPGPVDIEQIPELEHRGRNRFRATLELFDGELGDRDFLCGDAVTLADIDLLAVLDVANWVKESLPESCENLHRWVPRTRAALGIAES